MKLVQVIVGLGVIGFTTEMLAAPLSKSQQQCIKTINTGASRVHAAQGRANTGCVRDYATGKIASAEGCLLSSNPRVAAFQEKLIARDAKDCSSVPPFAYTNGGFAGDAAYQAAAFLMHDIYSYPLETGLHRCATNPSECLCEQKVSGRLEKLLLAMNKTFLKCAQAALAPGKEPFPGGAGDAVELAQCLSNGAVSLSVAADARGEIAHATQDLLDTTAALCSTTANDEFSNGVCYGLDDDPAAFTSCVVDQAECYICQLYKAIDALGAAIDCQAWSGAPTCAP